MDSNSEQKIKDEIKESTSLITRSSSQYCSFIGNIITCMDRILECLIYIEENDNINNHRNIKNCIKINENDILCELDFIKRFYYDIDEFIYILEDIFYYFDKSNIYDDNNGDCYKKSIEHFRNKLKSNIIRYNHYKINDIEYKIISSLYSKKELKKYIKYYKSIYSVLNIYSDIRALL
jgi:hypothetical protein